MPRKNAVNTASASRRLRLSAPLLLLVLLAAFSTGCSSFALPSLPRGIAVPAAEVVAVRCVDHGPAASRYQILVTVTNPNDFPLPVVAAEYTLTVAGNTYKGDTPPPATLPANGAITVTLPAAIPGATGEYSLAGHITVHPPGQIKEIIYDMGVPFPRARFESKGVVEDVKPQNK